MATKKSAPKKKRSPKKRKPKVKLDNKKVMAVAAIMIFVCAVILSLTFIVSAPETKTSSTQKKNRTAVEKQAKPEQKKKPAVAKTDSKPAAKSEKSQPVKTESQKKPEPKPEAKRPLEKSEVKTQPKNDAALQPKKTERTEPKAAPKIEKKTESKVQPKAETKPAETSSRFSIPQSRNNARLCFIIDDGGQKTANLRKYTTLPFPIAVAVLPQLGATKECARIVVADRKELMLHQPMQAQNLKMNPGPGAILPDMSLREVYATVSKNLSELGPHVKGFNNHEGSLITCDLNMMGAVLDAAADNKVYFVDSRTSKDTMAPFAALERDMKILEREVFIDDIIDRAEMLKQIMRGIDIANKKGKVIMIGHVDKSAQILPALLSEMYPELKAKGYRLVFPSQLL
ncbi:MAG: divergent polysaccharide deacetylase family protein [Spirochaetales bacterium]|nr:divergent polysaccharide deacetylase family protein [Spirochaetales bacterium]